jgi:hypothetical protein
VQVGTQQCCVPTQTDSTDILWLEKLAKLRQDIDHLPGLKKSNLKGAK